MRGNEPGLTQLVILNRPGQSPLLKTLALRPRSGVGFDARFCRLRICRSLACISSPVWTDALSLRSDAISSIKIHSSCSQAEGRGGTTSNRRSNRRRRQFRRRQFRRKRFRIRRINRGPRSKSRAARAGAPRGSARRSPSPSHSPSHSLPLPPLPLPPPPLPLHPFTHPYPLTRQRQVLVKSHV